MCDNNENIILDLDFSNVDDSGNWFADANGTATMENDRLMLENSGTSAVGFVREIGYLDGLNNRLRIQSNFDVQNITPDGSASMEVLFQIMVGNNVIHEGCVQYTEIPENNATSYFMDRTFVLENPIVAPIFLKIIAPSGSQNKITLTDLKVWDFTFCVDNVRTYFIVDDLHENSLTAQSGGIELLEWKVEGNETLTTAFFNEVQTNGVQPDNAWFFARANIDGTNRDNARTPFNTFNPFVAEFGLQYDSGTYYGGLPTGTISGSDYGDGIMKIGFEKPAILNGLLQEKKGGFFLDIDYTKSLKVVFNVVLNQLSNNLFSNPTTYREYNIEWNAETCEKLYYYKDKNNQDEILDILVDGFLSELTGVISTELVFDQDTKILMYFDSSGSMNSTLAPLETMRDTLLRDRLLPFYNNDNQLYDDSVFIVNDPSERTMYSLDMQNQTPPDGNVVVLVFQDEANTVYHGAKLETTRTTTYDTDLATLRGRLNSYAPGYYRAVIFQVAGSNVFSQFIQAIQNGTSPYNGTNGLSDRVEFGYNYNVQDGGTPQYYLDLIVAALQNLGYAV